MTFEEYYQSTIGAVGSECPDLMAKWAWQAAYMQASAEMRGYTINDVDYAENDAVLEVDGINLYFQFSKEATLAEAAKYLKRELSYWKNETTNLRGVIYELNECLEQALSDLKYWEEKAMNLEYEKTLTGDSAV